MKTVIADHTNTIALTLWEDLIDAVDCGKTCKFKNVKIRSFNDIKYLTTTEGITKTKTSMILTWIVKT